MGAINYKTSDYITLGVDLNKINNYYYSKEYEEECFKEYGKDININDFILEDKDYTILNMLENIQEILENYNFYYFHITIDDGYYEGFSINIENNFQVCFDDYKSKLDAQKEISQIKKCLLNFVNNGLVEVFPGWVTGYNNKENTKKSIKNAIKQMRQEVKNTPTYYTYKWEG